MGSGIKQRGIAVVTFPYTDLSDMKRRPALVISKTDYNSNNADVICCAITTQEWNKGVEITDSDMVSGHLKLESQVAPDKLFLICKSLIERTVGRLNKPKSKKVVERLDGIIEIEE